MKTRLEQDKQITKCNLQESLNFHDLFRTWDDIDNTVKVELDASFYSSRIYTGWVTANGKRFSLPSLNLNAIDNLRIELSPIVCSILRLINEETDWGE